MRRSLLLYGALTAWVGLMSWGFSYAYAYMDAPAPASVAPPLWPKESDLSLDSKSPTVVMFVHPKCPCTAASLEELKSALEELTTPITLYACFLDPTTLDASWTQDRLWSQATRVPGLKRVLDADGAESHQFGARSSGFVVAYSPTGRLLFQGGLTMNRGHQGNNPGRAMFVRAITEFASAGSVSAPGVALTFGCDMFSKESEESVPSKCCPVEPNPPSQ